MTITPAQFKTAVARAAAVAEAIRSLGEIPSGHLYAQLMGQMTLSEFNAILLMLEKADLVSNTNHLLKWIGPAK